MDVKKCSKSYIDIVGYEYLDVFIYDNTKCFVRYKYKASEWFTPQTTIVEIPQESYRPIKFVRNNVIAIIDEDDKCSVEYIILE